MQTSKRLNHKNQLIILQDFDDFDKFRHAGRVTANCLSLLESEVQKGTTKTLLELDQLAEEFFLDHNTTPVFKGYHGFPNTCCISVNQQLVHGVPTDYSLKEGDLVSFDTGCIYQGGIADSAL